MGTAGRYDEAQDHSMKRIAVIGSGISGLASAYLLSRKHQVTLFEANTTLGGHTATVDIELGNQSYAIDTGFIVFNDRTYPNFLKLLDQIGVSKKPTEMSFSVQHNGSGIEYNGNTISTLFAQKKNLLSPRFYHFLYEIIRFNRISKKTITTDEIDETSTLGDFLATHHFSDFFAEHYILPMVAAIWSSSINDSREFPLKFFLNFFNHHGLLNIIDRPQWYVIEGGSRSYIPALSKTVDDIRLNTAVKHIERYDEHVIVATDQGEESFDEVVIACHSNQAIQLLKDASAEEKEILNSIQYRNNEVTLHIDDQLLPKSRIAWASWNFSQGADPESAPAVTYYMNLLQGFDSDKHFCVSLNQTASIKPSLILREFNYAHPVFDQRALVAQKRRNQICGHNRTHFCGAYWYNGFHEDGLRSALDVCRRFGVEL
jgi:uncharacterized protein